MSKATKATEKETEKEIFQDSPTVTANDPAIKSMIDMINKGKYVDAVRWIERTRDEQEQAVKTSYIFDAYPIDGAVAFHAVLRQKYGWIEQIPPKDFWGNEKPPAMVSVETAQGTMEVPWGQVAVPGIEGTFGLGAAQKDGMWKFQLTAVVRKKHMSRAKDLMELTRLRLTSHSIYKGQSISLKWEEEEGSSFSSGSAGFGIPQFIKPSGMGREDLILPEHIAGEIEATIFSLIEHYAEARAMGIPTKRLILLAGPYGVGKTLTAAVTAEICRKVGRTFAYLRHVEHLADAVYFLQSYAPACVFGEDIDAVDPDTMELIANTVDGIDTKNIDMIFILTTNHPDQIPEKFLRAGRSDMVVQFSHPDAEAAARLIVRYGGATLQATFDEALRVGEELAQSKMIPASIREVVERSKLFALARGQRTIDVADLKRAAHSVIQQLKLLKHEPTRSLPEHLEEVGIMVRNKNGHSLVSMIEET